MFSTKCLELVKAQQETNNFVPTMEYNKHLLNMHKKLMDENDYSRSICPYNLEDTTKNKYIYKRCKTLGNCNDCKGSLLYHIWFLNDCIQGDINILNNNKHGLEFKEACFSHLKDHREMLKETLIKAHKLGL